jgi:hypothetical protein
MYVYDPPRSISLNKLAKNGQNSPFELFKKGRKWRFTTGIVFVSACWDLPPSVHINFMGKNAGKCPKLNGFSGEIFLPVRSKHSGEWQLSTAFRQLLE